MTNKARTVATLQAILQATDSDPISNREKRIRQALQEALEALQAGRSKNALEAIRNFYLKPPLK